MSDMGGVSRVLVTQGTRDSRVISLVITQDAYTRGLLVKYWHGIQRLQAVGDAGYSEELSSIHIRNKAFWARRRSVDFKLLSATPCI